MQQESTTGYARGSKKAMPMRKKNKALEGIGWCRAIQQHPDQKRAPMKDKNISQYVKTGLAK